MFMDNSLKIALLISAIFHTLIFLPLSYLINLKIEKSLPSPKITYLASKMVVPDKVEIREIPVKPVRKRDKMQKKEEPSAPEQNSGIQAKEVPASKVISVPRSTALSTKIEIPPELPKEEEAVYLSYYQSIRAEIKRAVIANYSQYISCGEVCLYFILLSNGELKTIRVVEERSTQNSILRQIAKRSVQQAAPFSAFPKRLNQRQLSFNVIISFELEN